MKKVSSILFLLLPFVTFAHPGHGETEGYSIIHYFTEPLHIVVLLSVLALAFVVSRLISRKKA